MNDFADFNTKIIAEFRDNDGKVGGMFEGAPLLLLHHTGAKSGQHRVTPIMYQQVGSDYAIFASVAGAPKNPAWFHNLIANPDVRIEVGTREMPVKCKQAEGQERTQIWERQKELFPTFAEYEAKTTREIPVLVLTPR